MPDAANILVIGQGYVGLPLSCALAEAGFSVTGYDLNHDRVGRILAGESGIDHRTDAALKNALTRGYVATSELAEDRIFDAVVVCVPTPLGAGGGVDLTAVLAAAKVGADVLVTGGLFVLESTSFPGTTEEYVKPILEEALGTLDEGFLLAFSPERIDPGNERFTISNTPRVVGGASEASAEAAASLYRRIVDDVMVLNGTREAEMAKLLENTYRQVNIALANELARVCHEMGIDYWNVVRGAATKPYGFQPFFPGPGVGGHCIPIDPIYLNEKVREVLGRPLEFVELAQAVNNGMPRYVAHRIFELLEQHDIAPKKARVLLLGATYKADVGDRRGAPIDDIFATLLSAGCTVEFHDPHCESIKIDGVGNVQSVASLEEACSRADLVVVLQAHSPYRDSEALHGARLLFDTRGVIATPGVVRL